MSAAPVPGPAPRRIERPWQLALIALLALLVFGAMGVMYVQSLSLPKCGTNHIATGAVVRPEQIRCRK